ncbi:hypothetical protein [Stutzerimonas nitrititolerans]|uniref:hypothetical protein n=1 Tax=Stutzerimonas nitrititolerans TaxID=2482751 RepID=UPI002898ACF3|nr:hypothetical protein [Stutzerimonas nitrititolerans]
MKRINYEKDIFGRRAALRRHKIEVKRKPRHYCRVNQKPKTRLLGRELIKAPENISIYDFEGPNSHYEKTISFLEDIGNRYMRTDCYIDFSETKLVTAAALVLVYSAIETARIGRHAKANLIWSQKSDRVNQILKTSNLQKLIQGNSFTYSLSSARHMPIVSSVGSNQMDEIIDFIQRSIYAEQMTPNTEYIYGDAVSETINNVGLHAYPAAPDDEKRWWLMCQTFGKKLYLAIYDRGVGIPKTVVERSWFLASMQTTHPEEYQRLTEEFPELEASGIKAYIPTRIPDQNLIYLSMQGDVTGTKKDKHGQGSKSIMALVSDTDDGLLWVFSNKGLYTFRQADRTPGLTALSKKFPGTLVQWNIEIP